VRASRAYRSFPRLAYPLRPAHVPAHSLARPLAHSADTNPIWTVKDLVAGTYVDRDHFVATERNVSFSDFVVEYTTRCHVIWWYNTSAFLPSDPNVFWVEQNVPVMLADALNASLFLSAKQSEGLIHTVETVNWIVLTVALVVFFVVTFAVIAPVVTEVSREQRAVFTVLGKIPVKALRHLRDALAERINQLQRAASGEEDSAAGHHAADAADAAATGAGAFSDDALASAADGAAAGGGAAAGAGGARYRGATLAAVTQQSRAKAAAIEATEASDKVALRRSRLEAAFVAMGLGCCVARWRRLQRQPPADSAAAAGPNDVHARAASAAAKDDMPARVFANESSGFVGLFARMVWPIAVFAVYYIAMYSLRSASATATYFGEYAVLWSVQLGVLSSALGASFRYMYLYQEPEWNKLFTRRTHEQVEMFAALADDIVYGSPERHLQSLVANSPSTYNLMLVNGCVASPISAKACEAYGAKPYYGCNKWVSPAPAWRRAECAAQEALECEALHVRAQA